MKYAKIFAIFVALHAVGWIATHFYSSGNDEPVLLVVDTSFAMKTKFPKIRQWIDDYEKKNRYKTIIVGTDKVMLGDLTELASKDVIFRTSFGKLHNANLQRYSNVSASKKILLSDGSLSPSGWETIEF